MPGSWEILKSRENQLLLGILVPPDRNNSYEFTATMRNLILPPGSDIAKVEGLPFGPARNAAAKEALSKGKHLAFLDADVRPEPDAFLKLLATGLDLVSGLYYQRFWPYQPVMFNEGRDDKGNYIRVPVTGWRPGDLVPCTFVPAGLLLVRRRLLEAIFQRFPRPFEWGLDTAPVPNEEGQVPPFSEDFVFSYRCLRLGVQPFVHTGIVGLHEVRAVIGPRWHLPLPSPDPLHGVCSV